MTSVVGSKRLSNYLTSPGRKKAESTIPPFDPVGNPIKTSSQALSVGIRDLLADYDAQLRELEKQVVQLEGQIPYLSTEIEGVKELENKRKEMEAKITEMQEENSILRDKIVSVNLKIQNHTAAKSTFSQIEAIKDKEIRRLRALLEKGNLNIKSYISSHLSLKKETEKESKQKVMSDRAVEVAKEEVGNLEEKLSLLSDVLEHEKNDLLANLNGLNASEDQEGAKTAEEGEGEGEGQVKKGTNYTSPLFIQRHQALIPLHRQYLSTLNQLTQLDRQLEDRVRRKEALIRIKESEDRHLKALQVEQMELQLLKKRAKLEGVKVPKEYDRDFDNIPQIVEEGQQEQPNLIIHQSGAASGEDYDN